MNLVLAGNDHCFSQPPDSVGRTVWTFRCSLLVRTGLTRIPAVSKARVLDRSVVEVAVNFDSFGNAVKTIGWLEFVSCGSISVRSF